MLVLTRKAGETICLGNDIRIKVVKIRGNQVRIAIEAPREVSIRREEISADADDLEDALVGYATEGRD